MHLLRATLQSAVSVGAGLKVIWAVLCRNSAIDKDTNNVSLFEIIEEITFPAPPPEPPQWQQLPARLSLAPLFQLIILWTRSNQEVPEQGRGRVRILLPANDREAMAQEFEVDLTQYLRLRNRINVPGFPVGPEGIYRFVVESMTGPSEWAQVFELPVRVVIQRQDSA